MDGDSSNVKAGQPDRSTSLSTKIAATATGILNTIGAELSNAINGIVTVKPPINLPHRSYAVGDCVFRSKPFVWVIGNKHISNFCSMCAVRLPESSNGEDSAGGSADNRYDPIKPSQTNDISDFQVCKCPTCELATYCNPRCRQEAWTVGMHQKECILYQRWIAAARRDEDAERRKAEENKSATGEANGTPTADEATKSEEEVEEFKEKPLHGCVPKKLTRMIALTILKLADGQDRDSPGQSIPECNVSFWDLMSHWEGERRERQASVESVEWIRDQLEKAFPEEWTRERNFLEFDKLGNVYGRILTNVFYVREFRLRLIQFATALYLNPSKIDHSCTPSASYVHTCGNVLEVYAVEPRQKFSDVRLSYVSDLMRPRQFRSSQMTSLWLFECGCDGCQNDERERLLCGLLCTRENCTGAVCADLSACKRKTELELSVNEAVHAPYPAQTEDATGVVDAVLEKSDKESESLTEKIEDDPVVKSDDAEADNGDDVNNPEKDVENPDTEVLPPMLPSVHAEDYACTSCGFRDFPQAYIDEALQVLDGTVKFVDNNSRNLETGLPLLERALKCAHPSNAMMVKFLLLILDTNWRQFSTDDIDREMPLIARVLPILLLNIVRTMSYLPREVSFQFTIIIRALRYVKYIVEFKGTKTDDGTTTANGAKLLLQNLHNDKKSVWNVSKNDFLQHANELLQILRSALTLHFGAAMRDHERMVKGEDVGYGEEKPVVSGGGEGDGGKKKPDQDLTPSVPWCSAIRKRGIYAEETLLEELNDDLTPMIASINELFEQNKD